MRGLEVHTCSGREAQAVHACCPNPPPPTHRVSTALVLLATAPPAPIGSAAMAVPVCLVISREITMSSLREWAAVSGSGAHKAVKVNSLG